MIDTKIVAVIIDSANVITYDEKGNASYYRQGDPKIRFIKEVIVPNVEKHGYYNLTNEMPDDGSSTNTFSDYEKKSKIVKFFSIAKSKLAAWLSKEDEPVIVGEVPSGFTEPNDAPVDALVKDEAAAEDLNYTIPEDKPEPSKPSVDELVKEMTPSNSKKFCNAKDFDKEANAFVAMIDGKIIEDVDKLEGHLKHSNMNNSTEGVDKFLQRIAAVVDERKHSIKDLMAFMEFADLPISKEGYIIVYKALTTKVTKVSSFGEFNAVDSYTKKVPQRVGTVLRMDVGTVDPDRHNSCSKGLHIASRSYLSSYRQDVCYACYVDPADVVAVPANEHTKMRVASYAIIKELPDTIYKDVLHVNRGIGNSVEGREILKNMINHTYVAPSIEVFIPKSQCDTDDLTYKMLSEHERDVYRANNGASPVMPSKNVKASSKANSCNVLDEHTHVEPQTAVTVEDVRKVEEVERVEGSRIKVTDVKDTTKPKPKVRVRKPKVKSVVKPKRKIMVKPKPKKATKKPTVKKPTKQSIFKDKCAKHTLGSLESAQALDKERRTFKKGWGFFDIDSKIVDDILSLLSKK